MKCYKCGNELEYFNNTTLTCPFCHSHYTVSEKVAEKQKNLNAQEKTTSVENNRPNCSVYENSQVKQEQKNNQSQQNTQDLEQTITKLENEIKKLNETLNNDNLDNNKNLDNEKNSKDKKKKTKKEDSNLDDKEKDNNKSKEDSKKKDDSKKENKKEKDKNKENQPNIKVVKKSFSPFIIFLNTILISISIFLLPYLSIIKESYLDGKIEEDFSIFLYKNCTLDTFEILFQEYFYLPLIGVGLTLLILTLCIVGILQYLGKNNKLFILYEFMLSISLLLIVSYFVCYFSLPNEIYSAYKLSMISYTYFPAFLSLINLLVLKKVDSKTKKN